MIKTRDEEIVLHVTAESIANAVKYLKAKPAAPGYWWFSWCDEHDHPANGPDTSWYIADASALVDLVDCHGEFMDVPELPAWCKPWSLYLVRKYDLCYTAYEDEDPNWRVVRGYTTLKQATRRVNSLRKHDPEGQWQILTIDLVTGEQIVVG